MYYEEDCHTFCDPILFLIANIFDICFNKKQSDKKETLTGLMGCLFDIIRWIVMLVCVRKQL